MKLIINKRKMIAIMVLIPMLVVYNSFFNLGNYRHLYIDIVFFCCCISILFQNKKVRIYFVGLINLMVPLAIVTVLSVITAIKLYHTTIQADYTQSILRFFYLFEAYTIAYCYYKKFGKESVRLFIIAGLISYCTVIFKFFYYGRFQVFSGFFNANYNGITLEVHNLTYILGMFFLYYLLSDDYTAKFKKKILIVLIIGIFLGDKRAIYVALIISLFVYWVFNKLDKKNAFSLKIITIIYIVTSVFYLYIIKNGILESFLFAHDIDSSSRITFWNYFKTSYALSPLFFGRGIAYTSNVMATRLFQISADIWSVTELHNDILRSYIGWGCLPFLFYFFNFIYLQPNRILIRKGKFKAWKYFAIVSYIFFVLFFDNMLLEIDFNIAFFILWFIFYDNYNYDNNVKGIKYNFINIKKNKDIDIIN